MQEIDFVMSDLSLEIIGDFAIVWLLSPKKTFAAAPTSALGKITSQLPGHALQVPIDSKSTATHCICTIIFPFHSMFVVLVFPVGSGCTSTLEKKPSQEMHLSSLLKQDNPAGFSDPDNCLLLYLL